ncbi:phage minor head protein [Paenibacillus sp. M1]|uniref:Phage minor head protein n=1 Tax=Paenibacillus haidiansis TaxID=1574488 RepID=A0ABU7VPH7_9BACL
MKDLFELLTEPDFKFEEAAEFFGNKLLLKSTEFYQLAEEYRHQAFTVSGYSKIQVLKKFQDELLKAIEEGKTMREFKDRMNDFLERRGYEGITNFQADNIFRTNVQTAYNVGHYKQMTDPSVLRLRPYWQYDAVNDQHTRPSHLAMDGRVFRADDPIWNTWYPPNGFRCRCGVKTLSERQVRERGLTVETSPPVSAEVNGRFTNIIPDPNFATNPAKDAFKPDVSSYPEPLRKAFEQREKRKTKTSP